MFFILSLFWFIRTAKIILFWLYLWQLKEYHLGRFRAHFQTAQGKKICFNKIIFLKIALVLFVWFVRWLYSSTAPVEWAEPSYLHHIAHSLFYNIAIGLIPLGITILYLIESIKALKDVFQKRLKRPIITPKTLILIFAILICVILFLTTRNQSYKIDYIIWLLLFDIFTPLIVSLIVLSSQPLTVLLRNQIIKKAKRKRRQFENLLTVGITGSYGKTSTKEFLYAILTEKFGENKILKTKEHQNSEVGISQCILQDLKPEHEIFICEMGAYNRGGIKLLCDIAKPKIGILTGINEQHMATFGSQENIISAKFELIEGLPEGGVGILNGDNKYINPKSKCQISNQIQNPNVKNVKFYSTEEKMDVWAEDIKVDKEEIFFKVFAKDGDFAEFNLVLLGKQNVENILAAACCAKELGMTLKEISAACEKIKPMPGAGELIKTKSGLNIIDATYSANPDGALSHLEYLKLWEGKKIIVMPCLIELGRASKEVHQRIGEGIGAICDLAIITTKECFENIKNAATKSGLPEKNILFIEDPKIILEKIKEFCPVGETAVGDLPLHQCIGGGGIILLESRVPKELIKELQFNILTSQHT